MAQDTLKAYLTPAEYGQDEMREKKSRFISRVWPCATEAQAQEYLARIRKECWDATHNVYAYITEQGRTVRCSDDGEPQGTSGLPTLHVFQAEGIVDVCCITTRYFGGILLGAGGLARAYTASAKLGLDAAGISHMRLWSRVLVPCSYALYEKIHASLENFEAVLEQAEFTTEVMLDVFVPVEKTETFMQRILDLSSGLVQAAVMETTFRPVRIR